MISLNEAIELIQYESKKWNSEEIAIELSQSITHVLSQDVRATSNHPSFSKSAMDGYAVAEQAGSYELASEIQAGDCGEYYIEPGKCYRIFTGAKIPKNCTQVIRQEYCEREDKKLRVIQSDQINIMFEGEDFKQNDVIIETGVSLHSAHIGLLAGQGIEQLQVFEKTSIGVISSGEELVPVSSVPKDSQIRNSNSSMLISSLNRWNHPAKDWGIVSDNLDELTEVLHEALGEHDVILISGGASKGKYDLVKPACRSLGVEFLIEGVRIRPGKPFSYGSFGSKGVFVLPGNPVAAYLCYLILVQPFLEARNSLTPIKLIAKSKFINKKPEFSCLIPAKISNEFTIEPIEILGAGHIHALAKADYCVLLEEGIEEVQAGEAVLAVSIR